MEFWSLAPVPGLDGERHFLSIGDVLDQQREFGPSTNQNCSLKILSKLTPLSPGDHGKWVGKE